MPWFNPSLLLATIANAESAPEAVDTRRSAKRTVDRELQFRQLVLGVKDYAIFMLDPEGIIATWNPGAERIKGYRAEEVLGRHFSIFYPEESLARDWPRYELEAARAQGRFEDEGWRLRKDGSRFWANVVITALHDEAGRLTGFAKITRDLTERRRNEEKLRAAHEELERRVTERTAELTTTNESLRSEIARRTQLEVELRDLGLELAKQVGDLAQADRLKNEFLAMLAHELRNPMAPISNGLEILTASIHDSGAAFTLERMQRQMRVLVRLVDDLLDVSRIVRGRIELRCQPMELEELVKAALESADTEIDAHGHQIAVSLPENRVSFDGDPVRLAQVLSNLLVNAAKYSEQPGTIEIKGAIADGVVEIRVRDHGIGIAPEFLPKIFDLFTQADSSLDRTRGGLGIGLTLARRLVELHGGTLTASSKGLGHGSEMVMRVPVESGAEVAAPRESNLTTTPISGATRRVLVIDDSVDAAESTAALVRLWGHQATVLHSGEGVAEVVDRFHPHVVLLDIGLPGKDGYEIARQLRSLERGRSLVIAAVTGYGRDEDRRRAEEAGFDYHFVKPIDFERLKTILSS